jgi:hypothetical protein
MKKKILVLVIALMLSLFLLGCEQEGTVAPVEPTPEVEQEEVVPEEEAPEEVVEEEPEVVVEEPVIPMDDVIFFLDSYVRENSKEDSAHMVEKALNALEDEENRLKVIDILRPHSDNIVKKDPGWLNTNYKTLEDGDLKEAVSAVKAAGYLLYEKYDFGLDAYVWDIQIDYPRFLEKYWTYIEGKVLDVIRVETAIYELTYGNPIYMVPSEFEFMLENFIRTYPDSPKVPRYEYALENIDAFYTDEW